MSEGDNGDAASAYVVPDNKPGRVPTKDFKPLTFNIEDVKRTMLHGLDGDHTKLTKKQQGQLKTLAKLDNDGDGEISLMEIISLEEHLEDQEKQNKRMKKILCVVMLCVVMFLLSLMMMGMAAIEITKESRVRGGAPVASAGSSATVPASPSARRRRLGKRELIDPNEEYGKPWDQPEAIRAPPAPQKPFNTADKSLEAKYMAYEGKTGAEKQKLYKQDNMKHCDKCKEAIEAEHKSGAVAPFDSLVDPECLKCSICLFNNGGTTQIAPTHDCPTRMDPVAGEKPIIDQSAIQYGIGSDEAPITMTQGNIEWLSKEIKAENEAANGVMTEAQANWAASEMLSGLTPTIVNGAPRTFVVDGTSSAEHFEGIKEIQIACPGNDAIDDMTLEGIMAPEETSPGYGNMAEFVVPGGGPADADGHVHIGADGRIRVSKSLQTAAVAAGQLGGATNLDPDRPEGTMTLPVDHACYIKAKGTSSPGNMKPAEFAMDMSPDVDMAKFDPVKRELEFATYPAVQESPPSSTAYNFDYTEMKQCDHPEAANPCTINDPGVQSYVMGSFVDGDNVEHPIHHLFREQHGTVTHDAQHDLIETEGEYIVDDTTGVSMYHGETTMVTHTPDGMDDTMIKEQQTYCQGMYCQDMASTIAPEVTVNFDGSMTCGDHECITAPVESNTAPTIPPGGGVGAMTMGPMAGNFMEMHEAEVTSQVRRLIDKHNRLGTYTRNTHKKNAKAKYHPLLAAHTYRNLVAAVAPGDLTIYQSTTNGVMVEDCNAAHQYGIDTNDFNTVIAALPGDAPNTKRRRLRARTRKLAAKRHALSRHAFHRNMVRLVRKTHLRARRIARSHHKTRRRLMAFVEGSEHNYDPSMMHNIDTAAPAFELGPHGEHAMNIAHELGNEEWMDKDFAAAVDGGIGTPEYYAEESYVHPGDNFVAPVQYAVTQAAADCGGKKCEQTRTYKEMKVTMDHMVEAETHYAEVKETCLAHQTTLTTTPAADQYKYYKSNVAPCNEEMAEAAFEVRHANHSQHSAALSFRAEQNMFAAETYLVDHMYEYVQTADTAMEHATQEATACLKDSTQACTPESFDYEHYWETGETWDHEVDDPITAYPDFEAKNEAYVANHHVDEAVEALVGIGAAMNAMERDISKCTYMTFPPEPSTDGGMQFSRMHEIQFHPATDMPYRRLKQHDYGRKLRGQRRGAGDMGGTGEIQKRTRARVNERVDRMANERGTSAVSEVFRERGRGGRGGTRGRNQRNPPIEDPRKVVRDTRSERSTRSPATERSSRTRETASSVMNERRPIVKACSDTIADGDRRCNSCGGNRFSTVRPDATCDELCQKYRECEREVDATARDMVRASTERSVSLTSGGRRGQVQVQLREDPRQRGRRGEDESGGRSREYDDDRRRESGIPERDVRALDNARETIRRGMNERRARTESEENRRRGRVVHEMRGRIDHERERESGRRPEPRDTRIDTRVTRDRRRRSNTSFEDSTDSARIIQSPRLYRSGDGTGRELGHLDEPMRDIPERFKCRGSRPMPNCSTVVTYEPSENSPVRVTFEHNVNGPEELRREEREKKKEKAKLERQSKRKADEETRKREKRETRLEEKEKQKATAKADRKAKRQEQKAKKKAGKRRKLLSEEDLTYDKPNITACSNKVKERMCFDDFKMDEQTGLPSVVFGDKEKGEFRIFFEIPETKQSQKKKICLSIDYCGVVSLDPVTISGQATFPTKVANRIANDCLHATGDAVKCCPGTGKMTRDIARSNGKDEFFICDTSSMNTDSLVSPTYPVDLTIRHETDINAPVIELSDMGHSPMYITDGIKVDFHFFQEFFPTYAAESEFCAGFDVSSNIAGFTPDCPECSQCKGDGTDKKCNQHSNWNLCEMDPGCLYNNMTKQCNSLPGNDNLPKVESTQPRGCDDGTAYCRATKHGQAACVPVIDGKCLNCKDDSVFDHPERVRICATPSGPTCSANGQMYCAESRKCVDYCGYDCHSRGNSTGIPGVDLTHSPQLIGDPKSHVCAVPNPNVCKRLGKIFCELSQNCVDECADWACNKDMGASNIYEAHYTQLVEARAEQGVQFHSASNYVFYGNATTCKQVTNALCQADGKFLCKTQYSTECRDNCAWCDGKPAENDNGECVRPISLSAGLYYCPTSRRTISNCTGINGCHHTEPGMAPLDQHSSNNTCYPDPDFQKPGFYRCSIQTGRVSMNYDVEHCALECTAWDQDTNNFYAKKKHVNHAAGSNGPQRTCEIVDKDACTRAGMVWCPNDQTAMEDGSFTGDCVMDCHNCYRPVRIDNVTDTRTPANVQYLPLPVNKSNECIAQVDMRQECRNEGRYWCEGKQMCSADCSDCTDTVKEWGHNPVNYMWEEVEKVKHFQIPNFETGMCDVACPEATANVEHQSDWGSYTYTQRTPEAYCPLTKRCLRPTNFPYNHDENPVIASMNTVWNDDKSCSEQCGTYSMVKWEWSGQSSRTCIEATKENCAAEWKTWCPTTRQCLSYSDSCKEDCPGMPFKPPHGPDHQKYDSTSCMATKDEVAEKCKKPNEFGSDWASGTPQVYCDSQGWARCEDNCDSCTQYKDGETITSRDDGHGICSFKSVVTTHSEPVDQHIPQYNHTVTVEEDGTEYESWVEVNYTTNYTEESGEHIEVLDPWCEETQSHVINCDECGMTYSSWGTFEYSKMVTDESGANCIWPEKVYGCTDTSADNYNPHATDLEVGEVCPAGDMEWCHSCEYSSFNNTLGFVADALPEGQLDYYGMPMNLSDPDPNMYNYSLP